MSNSSNRHLNLGLDTALVFSATEDNLHSDLVAVKASFLYSENVQLASARLYYTLLAMRAHEKDERYQERLQRCFDKLLAIREHENDKRYEQKLRRCFNELKDAAPLDGVNPRELGVVMVNVPPPDKRSILAVIELAEGLRENAFSILSYDRVVQKSLDLMRGHVPTLEVIPVLDQDTFDRLDGFTRFTLGGPKRDAPGPLAQSDDRSSAYRAWLANEFLGRMPSFPTANWDVLLKMRHQLKGVRKRLLSTMDELAKDLGAGKTPDSIAEFAHQKWVRKVEAELEDIERKLERERSSIRLVGAGLPNLAMGIGLAITGIVEHHMAYFTIGALGTGGAAAALAVQQLAQEGDARRKIRDPVRSHPYWFLYRASKRWEPPTWRANKLEIGT